MIESKESEKSEERIPIMVSLQLHGKLNTIKTQLEQIIGKSMSVQKVIEVLLTAKPLDLMLQDLILELYPTEIKEPSKRQKQAEIIEKWFIEFLNDEIVFPKKITEELEKRIHDKLTMELLY